MARSIGIIGSGIGALAAGLRLMAAGFQVTIFESRSQPGGKASGINIEGTILDSGPTILRMPHLLADLVKVAGLDFAETIPGHMLSTHYRVYKDPHTYLDISSNANQLTEQMSRFSSVDANRYPMFLQRVQSIYQDNLTPPPVERKKRKPIFHLRPSEAIQPSPSVFQETSRFFRDKFLQQAFTFHPLLFGINPFHAHYRNLSLFAIEQQWGILSIDGGFHQVVSLLADRFQQAGGQFELNTPVAEIIFQQGQAVTLRLAGGKQRSFDTIISNLSPYATKKIITAQKTGSSDARMQSTSYFLLHMLCEAGPDYQSHTILSTNNYGRYIQEIFSNNKLPADPWISLHAQQAFDSGLQPLMAMTPVPNTNTQINWNSTVFRFRNKVVEKLDSYFPGFNQRIHYERISTPETISDEFNLPGGSALFPSIRQGIANLYFVGDNTWSGLGLIAALSSAEQVTKTIIQENSAMV